MNVYFEMFKEGWSANPDKPFIGKNKFHCIGRSYRQWFPAMSIVLAWNRFQSDEKAAKELNTNKSN